MQINETVTILHKLSNYNLDEDLDEQVNNYNKMLYKILTILCVILLAFREFGYMHKFYRSFIQNMRNYKTTIICIYYNNYMYIYIYIKLSYILEYLCTLQTNIITRDIRAIEKLYKLFFILYAESEYLKFIDYTINDL